MKIMKELIYCLCLAVMATCLAASCSDEPDEKYSDKNVIETSLETGVMILDAADIKGRYAFPLTSDELRMLRRVPPYFEGRWKKEHQHHADSLSLEIKKQMMDYGNMRLLYHISLPTEPVAYDHEQLESSQPFYDLVKNAQKKIGIPHKELSDSMFHRHLRGEDNSLSVTSTFFTARFNGNVTITADKELFGVGAGQDLSTHFGVEGACNCLPQGTLSDYSILFENFSTSRPTVVADFFAPNTWLTRNYVFWMKDLPEEKYDKVTFTITLPVACDYWRDFFAYRQSEMKHEERVLTLSFTVRFGQKSDFEEQINQRGIYPGNLWWY